MHYLIDGHNLIASLASISLEDPNDEARLVLQLRSWAAAGRRRVTVIFDGGLPGGESRHLSTGHLKVIFAPPGRTADDLLISRARQLRPPGAYTLVSSDRQVRAAAIARKMPVLAAAEFAQKLAEHQAPPPPPPPVEVVEEPKLSEEEVAEWLVLFGPEPAKAPAEAAAERPSPEQSRHEKERQAEPMEPEQLKSGQRRMSADELARWLALFEDGAS